jgi:hypothetical protein
VLQIEANDVQMSDTKIDLGEYRLCPTIFHIPKAVTSELASRIEDDQIVWIE